MTQEENKAGSSNSEQASNTNMTPKNHSNRTSRGITLITFRDVFSGVIGGLLVFVISNVITTPKEAYKEAESKFSNLNTDVEALKDSVQKLYENVKVIKDSTALLQKNLSDSLATASLHIKKADSVIKKLTLDTTKFNETKEKLDSIVDEYKKTTLFKFLSKEPLEIHINRKADFLHPANWSQANDNAWQLRAGQISQRRVENRRNYFLTNISQPENFQLSIKIRIEAPSREARDKYFCGIIYNFADDSSYSIAGVFPEKKDAVSSMFVLFHSQLENGNKVNDNDLELKTDVLEKTEECTITFKKMGKQISFEYNGSTPKRIGFQTMNKSTGNLKLGFVTEGCSAEFSILAYDVIFIEKP